MATIKGVWKFNETVTLTNIDQTVNYSCGAITGQTEITVIDTAAGGSRIMLMPAYSNVYYADSGWGDANNRVFDFGETGQEVSDEFATWVFENASGGIVVFHATDGNIKAVLQNNGTITLATAETYCETDIDVNVEVPADEPVLQEKTVTENGEVTADEGYDGLSKVTVDVPEQKPEETKTVDITANGTTTLTPTEGNVFSSVTVNTNVPTYITAATEEEATDTTTIPIVEGQVIVVTGA